MSRNVIILAAVIVALAIVAYLSWQPSLNETAPESVIPTTTPSVETAPQNHPPAEAPSEYPPVESQGTGTPTSPGGGTKTTAPDTQSDGAGQQPPN